MYTNNLLNFLFDPRLRKYSLRDLSNVSDYDFGRKLRPTYRVDDYVISADAGDYAKAANRAFAQAFTDGATAPIFEFGNNKTYASTMICTTNFCSLVGPSKQGLGLRTGNYGNTLVLGTSLTSISGVTVEKFYLRHFLGLDSDTGPTTVANPVTAGDAHILAWGPTRCTFRENTLWDMPLGLRIIGGSETLISNNGFKGLWDHATVACQITEAAIKLEYNAAQSYPTNLKIMDNDFVGYLSASRSVTWGTFTGNIVENIGPKYFIYAKAVETVKIASNSFGGANLDAIHLEPSASLPLLNIPITNNFFDGQRRSALYINNLGASAFVNNVEVDGNIFNGQTNSENAILVAEGGIALPSVVRLIITNNTFGSYVKAPIHLLDAENFLIAGNTVSNYNAQGGYNADTVNGAGVAISGTAKSGAVRLNNVGGGNGAERTGVNNKCAYGITVVDPITANSNVYVADNISIGLNNFDANVVDPALDNYVKTRSTRGGAAYVEALGSSANVTLELSAKGVNPINFNINGVPALTVRQVTAGNNFLSIDSVAAGNNPGFVAFGSDTNIGINIGPKGTGFVNAVTNGFSVAGTKVVGTRETGWTAGTGTANKAAFATYAGATMSAGYVQAEAQATNDAARNATQRIKAIEDALRTHGLIN